jgi:acyl-CoA synthetase (AMP-forming)/AMP-acid ligase II
MASATLTASLFDGGQSPAIIVPTAPNAPPSAAALTVSYERLTAAVRSFQEQLAAALDDSGSHDTNKSQAAVALALPNSLEFVVAFLGTAAQRAIAAPLNPAFKQDEFEFYIGDLRAALVAVPRGAAAAAAAAEQQQQPQQQGQQEQKIDGSAAVLAARKLNVTVAECYWDDTAERVVLDVTSNGESDGGGHSVAGHGEASITAAVETARADDIALVLHTSGTTGKPKMVSSF